MKLTAAIPAIFMIGLSALVLIGTSGLPYWSDITPGARFFPVWLAGVGIFLSLLLLFQIYRGMDTGETDVPDGSAAVRVGLIVAGLVAMALLTPVLGMVLSSALFVAYLLLLVLRQKVLPSLVTALIVGAGVEFIFIRWLNVSLPGFPF